MGGWDDDLENDAGLFWESIRNTKKRLQGNREMEKYPYWIRWRAAWAKRMEVERERWRTINTPEATQAINTSEATQVSIGVLQKLFNTSEATEVSSGVQAIPLDEDSQVWIDMLD